MMPSCDHTGVPGFAAFTHFHSSTTSGSASLMSLRILLKVLPRQSPSSAILLSISTDADWLSVESDFFISCSQNFHVHPPVLICLPLRGCTGRAFSGYNFAKEATSSAETSVGCCRTNHLTPSLQGGVVSEPVNV